MGRTYRANKPRVEPFDINYAGADILGIISFHAGYHNKKLEANNKKYNITDRKPSTYFIASRVECMDHASAIQDLTPFNLLTIYNRCISEKLFEGSFQDFKELVNQWINFLWSCDGYRVD
jgi:hypothetical protein